MINTTVKASLALIAVLVGAVAVTPGQWRVNAERAWSYAVYYVGYRMLSVQLSCGNLAVSGVPFVIKAI